MGLVHMQPVNNSSYSPAQRFTIILTILQVTFCVKLILTSLMEAHLMSELISGKKHKYLYLRTMHSLHQAHKDILVENYLKTLERMVRGFMTTVLQQKLM